MTDSLFNAGDSTGDDTAPQIDPNKNWLEELVGDGKKFKDPNELARGKAEADAFIARLTREQEELRRELNTRLTLEQYLDKMGNGVNQNNGRSDPPPNEPNGDGSNTTALKPEDIEALIEKKVSERERQRIQSQNLAEAKQKLVEAFGNDYPSKLREVSTSLGLTEDHLNKMASESPKAFLKLVGADNPAQKPQTPNSLFVPPTSQTTARPNNGLSGERTKKYYDEIKKRDPKAYWSPATQNQLHKDALRLGRDFFDS